MQVALAEPHHADQRQGKALHDTAPPLPCLPQPTKALSHQVRLPGRFPNHRGQGRGWVGTQACAQQTLTDVGRGQSTGSRMRKSHLVTCHPMTLS